MRPAPRLLLLAAFALSSAGCPATLTRCQRDDQCSHGQICSQGVCTSPCKPACGAGQVCDGAKCYPKDCDGQACPDNAFCDSGACVFHGCHSNRCAQNQTCVTGGVCVTTSCGGAACAAGTYCAAGKTCADSSCYGISCPEGQVCAGGKCHSKDCDGRSCQDSWCANDGYCKDCPAQKCAGADEECVEGACQSRDCLTDPTSSRCLNACRMAGRVCTTSQVCVGSSCVLKNCPDHACEAGSFCAGFNCVSDACQGVVCPDGSRCAGDGKCQPTSCGDISCADGLVCPASSGQCVSALCLGVVCSSGWECWAGGCYSKTGPDGKPCPTGELSIAGACMLPGGSAARCGAISCPFGFVCDSDACAEETCRTKSCPTGQGCFGGQCYPAGDWKADGGVVCDPGELIIAGECRATNGDKPILCGPDLCPAGYVCENDECFDVRCYGVSCPQGQRCAEGQCAPVTAPDGGTCPPGTVWLAGACTPEPPISGCGEGCVLDASGLCVPPSCLGGGCGQICGRPRCHTFCGTGSSCGADGECHSTCDACPAGFYCQNGATPPCIPLGCLAVVCPDSTHCVEAGGGPTCEPDGCGDGDCLPNEHCENGVCVDMTCAGVTCLPDEACYYGLCYPKCCPWGGECSNDTICYKAPDDPGAGYPVSRVCGCMRCPSSAVCMGRNCAPLGHNVACKLDGPQPLYCDGLDHDCNGTANDYVFYPTWDTTFDIFPDWDSVPQYLVDREPCTNTAGMGDWDKMGACDDGYNVYLSRFDLDLPGHPATHISSSGPSGMSSCIKIVLPCSRFMATKLNLKAHGTGSVSCQRGFANRINCSGSCDSPYLWAYTRTRSGHWSSIGKYLPRLDGNTVHTFNLATKTGPREVYAVLLCRDMSKADHASVSIDGFNILGCCKP